ncbi:hypothetical protein T492DRAFT_1014410 [Pavlovales sp. CCMP2436]|nr:hypothetical protein T492DRAFT_1014410 [Pavlovales sp. CCMP2436]
MTSSLIDANLEIPPTKDFSLNQWLIAAAVMILLSLCFISCCCLQAAENWRKIGLEYRYYTAASRPRRKAMITEQNPPLRLPNLRRSSADSDAGPDVSGASVHGGTQAQRLRPMSTINDASNLSTPRLGIGTWSKLDPWHSWVPRLDHWAHSLSWSITDPALNDHMRVAVTLGDRLESLRSKPTPRSVKSNEPSDCGIDDASGSLASSSQYAPASVATASRQEPSAPATPRADASDADAPDAGARPADARVHTRFAGLATTATAPRSRALGQRVLPTSTRAAGDSVPTIVLDAAPDRRRDSLPPIDDQHLRTCRIDKSQRLAVARPRGSWVHNSSASASAQTRSPRRAVASPHRSSYPSGQPAHPDGQPPMDPPNDRDDRHLRTCIDKSQRLAVANQRGSWVKYSSASATARTRSPRRAVASPHRSSSPSGKPAHPDGQPPMDAPNDRRLSLLEGDSVKGLLDVSIGEESPVATTMPSRPARNSSAEVSKFLSVDYDRLPQARPQVSSAGRRSRISHTTFAENML